MRIAYDLTLTESGLTLFRSARTGMITMAAYSNSETFLGQVRRNSVALISLFVALSSLAYNTWRNEATEANRNVRAAGFALIEHIAHLNA